MTGIGGFQSCHSRYRGPITSHAVQAAWIVVAVAGMCSHGWAEDNVGGDSQSSQVRVDVLVVRTTQSEQPKLTRQLKAFSAGESPAVCKLFLGKIAEIKAALKDGIEGEVVAAPSLIT